MYEIYGTQGQGEIKLKEVVTLSEALDYVEAHFGEMSFAIKKPDGSWCQWEGDTEHAHRDVDPHNR